MSGTVVCPTAPQIINEMHCIVIDKIDSNYMIFERSFVARYQLISTLFWLFPFRLTRISRRGIFFSTFLNRGVLNENTCV